MCYIRSAEIEGHLNDGRAAQATLHIQHLKELLERDKGSLLVRNNRLSHSTQQAGKRFSGRGIDPHWQQVWYWTNQITYLLIIPIPYFKPDYELRLVAVAEQQNRERR